MSYQVQLQAFHGPLDLLLYLVKKEEVDVMEISIAVLAEQFLVYLQTVRELDVEFAGEFLVMAATLMEIKSRALMPASDKPEADTAGVDPRRELVRQLLEYRRYKDAAAKLEEQIDRHAAKFGRISSEPAVVAGVPIVRAVELWDLVSAFARLLRETQSNRPQAVVVDDTPQQVYETRILECLADRDDRDFAELFEKPYLKLRLIGIFLALLELIKAGRVTLSQDVPFGPIRVRLAAARFRIFESAA